MKRLFLILLPLLLCGAASFNGSSQGASTSSSLSFSTNIISISYWVYHSATNLAAVMESSSNPNLGTAANPRFGLFRGDSGSDSEEFLLRCGNARIEYITGNLTLIWKHRVVVFNGTSGAGDIVLYTNGILAETTLRVPNTNANANGSSYQANRLFIGARNEASLRFSGSLQDIGIFAGEVSADEAYMLGAQRMSPLKVRSAKLINYWPFSAGENASNSPDLVGGIPVNSGTKSIVLEQAPTYRK